MLFDVIRQTKNDTREIFYWLYGYTRLTRPPGHIERETMPETKAKHTAEPLQIDPMSDAETIAICNSNGEHVCILQIDEHYPEELAEANAERIVSSFNGCRDIANPEAVGDLLKACETLVAIEHEDDGHCSYCNLTHDDDGKKCPVNLARKAIQRARGEE